MKTAIVTGATSGIGYEIAKCLLQDNYKVIGVGRKNSVPEGVHFFQADLTNKNELENFSKNITQLFGKDIDILVNAAGVGYFAPHEELNPKKTRELIELNLLAPIELCRQFLRTIKQNSGHIINIASITAKKPSPQGAAYSATKAGLLHFGESLFEEIRKSGAKLTTIVPDVVQTNFFENTWFEPSSDSDCYIEPQTIAKSVMFILKSENIITELVVKPQKVGIINKSKCK